MHYLEPVLLKLRNKLAIWKGEKVLLGVRVTLINVVLNSLHVFYFSFYKAPKWAVKEIIGIQRDFLWGGLENEKKHINWVSWSSICKHKLQGGLGIKCELFILALLGKWAWRIMSDSSALWLPLMCFKYSDIRALVLDHSFQVKCTKQSLWWRDLRLAMGYMDENLGCLGAV